MVNWRNKGVLKPFFKVFWYFETGKNSSLARLEGVFALTAFAKVIFGDWLTLERTLFIIPLVVVLLTLWGFVYKKVGLYDIDIYVKADKDPAQSEILTAARNINEAKKGGKL